MIHTNSRFPQKITRQFSFFKHVVRRRYLYHMNKKHGNNFIYTIGIVFFFSFLSITISRDWSSEMAKLFKLLLVL